ncbi:hypothetical protein E1B28_013606 [Marasmius oreades]|uniref:DNA (cytosine-5-)-methyltransferase n=1 Tax=Marasmius oreades TaxID=181124 RepID=A0A9P7RRC0_9AGAR|nr:uncharacterized protein E1B28_013606 [Marasmius oreades]KAG7087658.1 hypothetical protein E1B28_013606 [Marasmius oreades]
MPIFPTPTHGDDDGAPCITVREPIADLDISNPRKGASVGNPVFLAPTDSRKISRYARSMGATDTIENHAISKANVTDWPIANWDAPSVTLRTACSDRWACVHPSGTRQFSPREMARLMSFPDDYFFSGEVREQVKQIGNAVCPIVSRAFGESFKNALLQDYPELRSKFLQDDSESDDEKENPGKRQDITCGHSSKRALDDLVDGNSTPLNSQHKRARYDSGSFPLTI